MAVLIAANFSCCLFSQNANMLREVHEISHKLVKLFSSCVSNKHTCEAQGHCGASPSHNAEGLGTCLYLTCSSGMHYCVHNSYYTHYIVGVGKSPDSLFYVREGLAL